jgi:hypothetical protein
MSLSYDVPNPRIVLTADYAKHAVRAATAARILAAWVPNEDLGPEARLKLAKQAVAWADTLLEALQSC